MQFVETINKKKFTLISIFLLSYVMLNLLDGERGLLSYYEKQKVIKQFSQEKKTHFPIKCSQKRRRSSMLVRVCRLSFG